MTRAPHEDPAAAFSKHQTMEMSVITDDFRPGSSKQAKWRLVRSPCQEIAECFLPVKTVHGAFMRKGGGRGWGGRSVRSNITSAPSETGSVFLLRLPMREKVSGGQTESLWQAAGDCPSGTRLSITAVFFCAKAVIYSNGPTFVSAAVLCKSLAGVTSNRSGL